MEPLCASPLADRVVRRLFPICMLTSSLFLTIASVVLIATPHAHAASVRVRANASSHTEVRSGETTVQRYDATVREERGGEAGGTTSVRAQSGVRSGGDGVRTLMRACLRLRGMERAECYERQGRAVQGMRWVMTESGGEQAGWWAGWRDRLMGRWSKAEDGVHSRTAARLAKRVCAKAGDAAAREQCLTQASEGAASSIRERLRAWIRGGNQE